MKIILKIGYNEFFLPNDTGIQTTLRTLSKARRIEGDYDGDDHYHYLGDSPKVSMSVCTKENEPEPKKRFLGLPENGHRED